MPGLTGPWGDCLPLLGTQMHQPGGPSVFAAVTVTGNRAWGRQSLEARLQGLGGFALLYK